jgi:hypothetical protein
MTGFVYAIQSYTNEMHGLREGAVYTVARRILWHDVPELVLAEITRCPENPGFAAARFRRVVKQTYDLSAFQRILQKQGAPV